MFTLVLLFCLNSDPLVCRKAINPAMEPVPLSVCFRVGQIAARDLLETVPALRDHHLAKVHCMPIGRPDDRDA